MLDDICIPMCLCRKRICINRWRGFYFGSSDNCSIYENKQASRRIEAEERIHQDASREIEFVITAYCKENYPHICNDGESKYTSTGTIATAGRTIAVDPDVVPYGTQIEIEGIGVRIAEDTGGAIKGNRIDILFETHQEALEWGVQTRKATILN